MSLNSKIKEMLMELNPELVGLIPFISERINTLNKNLSKNEGSEEENIFSEKQTVLITYADQFQNSQNNVFEALGEFMTKDLEGACTYVHLLPFYPWTSDDGFSPTDYLKVDPELGDWKDLDSIPFPKMYDCVFNHISQKSEAFQKALSGDLEAQNQFHVFEREDYEREDFQENLKKVVRPRTSPLLTPYEMGGIGKYVWTTFSDDQIDTNLAHPQMLHYILESFFLYIEKGARMLRVDAVPFMWKELGTSCSHHPKTHLFVKFLRGLLDEIHVPVLLITESNVPHAENITYWGNGDDEAHVIYNFSLAPLVLHALEFEKAEVLKNWSQDVFDIPKGVTYLNFTATHDGIGMRGLEGLVPDNDVDYLCHCALERGGQIGKKTSRDGSIRPYELNITWASMMKSSGLSQEDYIRKVTHSHAIVMLLPGIGAHYVHNFIGTPNWQEGFEKSGIPRRLNRKKLSFPLIDDEVNHSVRNGLITLTKLKNADDAFHPKASFELIESPEEVFAFSRIGRTSSKKVYFNMSSKEVEVNGVVLSPFDLKIL